MLKLAQEGKTFMLPGWVGYFKWDYNGNSLVFNNGNYFLNAKQLDKFKLNKRTDWYYIV